MIHSAPHPCTIWRSWSALPEGDLGRRPLAGLVWEQDPGPQKARRTSAERRSEPTIANDVQSCVSAGQEAH